MESALNNIKTVPFYDQCFNELFPIIIMSITFIIYDLGRLRSEMEKCQGVNSSSDKRMQLPYWCPMHTAYIDSKVLSSKWTSLLEQ